MQLFKCQTCAQLLFFDNTFCLRCRSPLGYVPDLAVLSVVQPDPSGRLRAAAVRGSFRYRRCQNATHEACNWLIPDGQPGSLCRACDLNQVIPDLSVPGNLPLWQKLEIAKHQIVYALLKLGLPVVSRTQDPELGLGFVFAADHPVAPQGATPIQTGHLDGVITINLAEADDAERENRRTAMNEPYRTLLGHFRHEIGHYYWLRMVAGATPLKRFRELFGDDQTDYGQSLKAYYARGPAADWQSAYVSAYASSHPLEDFAETWAHYMHIIDVLDTAAAYGIVVHPAAVTDPTLSMAADFTPYRLRDFDRIVSAWLPLTYALNSLNRSMGHGDFYPFVLVPKVTEKLEFIHTLIRRTAH